MTIIAAADGSALGNPGPAGWSWYIDDDTWAAGGWKKSTNNRGELMAVAELLAATAHRADEELRILCDSQYVINSVTKWMPGWKKKGWKKRDGKPVLNVDILSVIDELLVGRNVRFEWVKGHAGHDMNEAADERARAAATAFQDGEPANEGPGFPGATKSAELIMAAAAGGPSSAAPNEPERKVGAGASQRKGLGRPAAGGKAAGQQGLFDVAADPFEEAVTAIRTAQGTLARAAAKAREGDEARLDFLTKRAVIVPQELDAAFPADFSSPRPDVTVVGATGVAVTRGRGWTATSTWDMSADPVLVAHHLSVRP
ncbi:RNase H family protein [Corynebacterium hansenii]|uniref:Ribonuclease H n=1 Tax=Corynebacterium hansenii TaxID=394964 RepID=A0ABV7ZR06_9CORY|nr:RNase H family protein [Corynebacterium hansenii]WJZ00140.1 Ribonuclease HI [Corynebacterium hansenii]